MRPKRFDENEAMLLQSILIAVAFWLTMLSLAFLSACTPAVEHQITLPQANQILDKIQPCPTLAMPSIPQECVIDIRGDSMTASSKDCEDLVRFYVRARQLLKPAAP